MNSGSRVRRFGWAMMVVGAAAAGAWGAPRVALVPADGLGALPPNVADVQTKLMENGTFEVVDIVNALTPNFTPDITQLQQYDAVMVWSNGSFMSGEEMGNVLADYVDGGGGVVLANFVTTNNTNVNRRLGGRWVTGNYSIIVPQGGNDTNTSTLGTPDLPTHPIMAGVMSFTNNTSSRPASTALTSHGQRVCPYADGKTLIAVSTQFPKRVDLGFHPPSSDSLAGRWDASTDGGKIMANAMMYAARVVVPSGTCCRGTTCAVVNATCSAPAGVGAVMVQPACNAGGSTTTPCCYADFNKDGSRNIDDIFVYLNAWFAPVSNPFTKIGGDGAMTASIDDLFIYLNMWFAGGCG